MKPDFRKVALTVKNKRTNAVYKLFPKPEFAYEDAVRLWFDVNFGTELYSLERVAFINEKKRYKVTFSKTTESSIYVNAANEEAAKNLTRSYLEYTGTPAYAILHATEIKE